MSWTDRLSAMPSRKASRADAAVAAVGLAPAQTFHEYAAMGSDTEVVNDRYLVAAKCRWKSCPDKTAIIVDLASGQVAFALLHYFSAAGRDLGKGVGLARFMKACADGAFRAFAEAHFVSWAKAALAEFDNPPYRLIESEIKTLTTRC